MATVETRTGAKGTSYVVRWREGGRTRQQTHRSRAAAEAHRKRIEHAADWDGTFDSRVLRERFGPVCRAWLASRIDLEPATIVGYDSKIRTMIDPSIGDLPLSRVGFAELDALKTEMLEEGFSPTHVGQTFAVIRQVIDWKYRAAGIPWANPARNMRIPQPSTSEKTFLTPEQVEALAEAVARPGGGTSYRRKGLRERIYECLDAGMRQSDIASKLDCRPSTVSYHANHRREARHYPSLATLVRLTAYTGLRSGEVSALTVGDLDLVRATVRVRASVDSSSRERRVKSTKSGHVRLVPLPDRVIPELADLCAGRPKSAPLFTTPGTDEPLMMKSFYNTHYRPAAVAIGIPHLRFHDLRHTFAAIMVDLGADLEKLRRVLGHSRVTVTIDHYGHLFPDGHDVLRDKLNERLASA